jgi:hypothetical protein
MYPHEMMQVEVARVPQQFNSAKIILSVREMRLFTSISDFAADGHVNFIGISQRNMIQRMLLRNRT